MSGFECLQDGAHEYSFKSKKGAVCSLCGVYYIPGCPLGYKSERYSSKVHFNSNDFEQILVDSDCMSRLTYSGYLEVRGKMVRFILDKGRLLKMSLKILHLAVYVMDIFCEKAKPKLNHGKDEVIAASALLIAAKSGELDERVPFITKLKKYANLDQDVKEFKKTEVMIAQALDWDLQQLPYYSYVEHYLASGVLSPQDRVSKRVLDAVTREGLEDTVRLLAREEATRNNLSTVLNALGSSNFSPTASVTPGMASSRSRTSSEESYPISLGILSKEVRAELIKVFELYARDLSNLVLRDFPHWLHKKNSIALAIIMYTRAAIFDPSQALSGRLQELSVQPCSEVRDTYVKLVTFIRSGESAPQVEQSTAAPISIYSNNYSSEQGVPPRTAREPQQSEGGENDQFRVLLGPGTAGAPLSGYLPSTSFHKGPLSSLAVCPPPGLALSSAIRPLSEQPANLIHQSGVVIRDSKHNQFRSSISIASGSKYTSRGNSTERGVYQPLSYQLTSNHGLSQPSALSSRRHYPSSSVLKENK